MIVHYQDINRERPPPTPTRAWPGSEEKIKVMRERARLKVNLHHPQDPKG